MMHLMLNFKKKFKADILDNMCPAAWIYELENHVALIVVIEAHIAQAIPYLQKHHSYDNHENHNLVCNG